MQELHMLLPSSPYRHLLLQLHNQPTEFTVASSPSESNQTEHCLRSAPFTLKLELRFASVYHPNLNTREQHPPFSAPP